MGLALPSAQDHTLDRQRGSTPFWKNPQVHTDSTRLCVNHFHERSPKPRAPADGPSTCAAGFPGVPGSLGPQGHRGVGGARAATPQGVPAGAPRCGGGCAQETAGWQPPRRPRQAHAPCPEVLSLASPQSTSHPPARPAQGARVSLTAHPRGWQELRTRSPNPPFPHGSVHPAWLLLRADPTWAGPLPGAGVPRP